MAGGPEVALQRNLPGRALAYMVLSIASFSLLDAGAKWLTGDYSVAQIIFLGRLFTLGLIFAVVAPRGGFSQFRTARLGRHLARAGTSVLTMASFFWALSLMPLADVVALTFAAPLIMTVLSVVVLEESVGARRWIAIAVGIVGVLVMLQPTGAGFAWTALIPLACALFYSITIIVSRQLSGTESTETLMLWVSIAAVLATAPFMPAEWRTPPPFDLAIFAFTGIASGAGQFFMVRAFRYGEVSMLAPMEYTALIWASALGFAIWGDVPGWQILVGAAIVGGSSLYIARRETRLARLRLTLQAGVPGEGAP